MTDGMNEPTVFVIDDLTARPGQGEALQRAYRILVRSKLKLDDALRKIESELGSVAEARYLVDFVRASKRGFIR